MMFCLSVTREMSNAYKIQVPQPRFSKQIDIFKEEMPDSKLTCAGSDRTKTCSIQFFFKDIVKTDNDGQGRAYASTEYLLNQTFWWYIWTLPSEQNKQTLLDFKMTSRDHQKGGFRKVRVRSEHTRWSWSSNFFKTTVLWGIERIFW